MRERATGASRLAATAPRPRGKLSRTCYPFLDKLPPQTFAVDASPEGIGGVLLEQNVPTAWFMDKITPLDEDKLGAKMGVSLSWSR